MTDILQNIQYTIENSSLLVNIILCIGIYLASGSSIFGIGKYINAESSLIRIAYNLFTSVFSSFLISFIYVKLQSVLHKYLLSGSKSDINSEKNIKYNALQSNIVNIVIYIILFSSLSTLTISFSGYSLLISIFVYFINTYSSKEDSTLHYNYFHIELPLQIAFVLSNYVDFLWNGYPFKISLLFFLPILSAILDCFNEQYFIIEKNTINNNITSVIVRPVMYVHHITWLCNRIRTNQLEYLNNINDSTYFVWIILSMIFMFIKFIYLRLLKTNNGKPIIESQSISNVRSVHSKFYNFSINSFDVTNYDIDWRLKFLCDMLKWTLFYPVHIVLTLIEWICIAKPDNTMLYIKTLDIIILFTSIIPVQTLDRYYLGLLYIIYIIIDEWFNHIVSIIKLVKTVDIELSISKINSKNTNNSKNSELNSQLNRMARNADQIQSDQLDARSEAMSDAGISVDVASELSENVILSEQSDQSTIISTCQNRKTKSINTDKLKKLKQSRSKIRRSRVNKTINIF
jgi:hypothetical protein